MDQKLYLQEIDEKIQLMKKTASEITEMSYDFPSLNRNTSRILASIKMLEMNISDIKDLTS